MTSGRGVNVTAAPRSRTARQPADRRTESGSFLRKDLSCAPARPTYPHKQRT